MRRIIFSLAVLIGFMPSVGFAHGTNYLEFNPDRSGSVKDADVATPSQVFLAQSDFLGGFDLWIANPGSSGTATFALLNEQDIVLTSKTVTIPNIALTSSGTKFHVDFNSQLPVLAGDRYSIRLTTSMPQLRLYYSDRIQLISHNAPPASPYITGVAKLGAEEQNYSFKYALYETNETSPPIVYGIGWNVVSETQMRIVFNANEAVDYRIEYGPSGQGYTQSTNFLGDYVFCAEGVSVCSLTINVSPDTTYDYRLTFKDTWNNQGQVTGTFASGQSQAPSITPTPSEQPPVISNLRVVNIGERSVSIAWTTNELANSQIIIKFSGFITITDAFDPTMELEHFLEIIDELNPNTLYNAEVISNDLSNMEGKSSISFTTMGPPTSTPTPPPPSPTPPGTTPAPSSSPTPAPSAQPQQSPASSPGVIISDNGTVQWNPPPGGEPNDGYRIDVFDGEGNLVKTIFAPSGSHEAQIPEGDYKIIVYSNDEGVFKKLDKPVQSKKIDDDTFLVRLLKLWPFLLIPIALAIVFFWLRSRKKPSQNPVTPVS